MTAISNVNIKNLSDQEVVERFMDTQKPRYFDALYDRYSSKVFSKCLAILRDRGMAEDATQDIFTRIFTKLSTFNVEAKFSTWIYAITYNYCIDLVRKQKRLPVDSNDEMGNLNIPTEDSNADKFFLEAEFARIKVAMDKLPVDDREVLMMKYKEDMSIKDICEVLDKSESAIKMKILRAKQKVRDHLAVGSVIIVAVIVLLWMIL